MATPAARSQLRYRWAQIASPRPPLALLLLVSLACRVAWINTPSQATVFDEPYYVNAARLILHWKVPPGGLYAGQPAGRDPVTEHPPLGKVLIAASMRVFGDTPIGWRLISILAGLASILLIYLIVVAADGDPWLGLLAAGLFAFDNLALVLSRVATLDIPLVAFLLLGTYFLFRRWPLAAGAACALATLVKLNGAYGFLALMLFVLIEAVLERRRGKSAGTSVRAAALLVAGFIPVFLGGLWALDLAVTPFSTPWDHLHHMMSYGLSLTSPGGAPVTIIEPGNHTIVQSTPWQWLLNETQTSYYYFDRTLTVGSQTIVHRVIDFRGAMNPIIISAASLGVFYALWRAWRLEDRLALWVVVWVAFNYLPYYPLVMVWHRAAYLYYFLPTLPAVTVGIALFLRRAGLPQLVVWAYLGAVLLGFIGLYPIRTIP